MEHERNMGDDFKVGIEKLAATLAKVVPPAITVPDVAAFRRSVTERTREIEERSLQQMVDLPAAGRPKGPSPVTAYLVAALERRLVAAGADAEPTPIAVDMFKALGFTGEKELKNRADGLVRAYKKNKKPRGQRFK